MSTGRKQKETESPNEYPRLARPDEMPLHCNRELVYLHPARRSLPEPTCSFLRAMLEAQLPLCPHFPVCHTLPSWCIFSLALSALLSYCCNCDCGKCLTFTLSGFGPCAQGHRQGEGRACFMLCGYNTEWEGAQGWSKEGKPRATITWAIWQLS